jgi:hypothetical protein
MKTKKDILFLTENGLSSKTISSLSDNQFRLLVEKFKKMKKSENKEQTQVVTQVYDTKNPEDVKNLNQALKEPSKLQGQSIQVKETEMTEDETDDLTTSNALGKDAEQAYTGQEAPHDANDMADDGMGDDSGEDRSMMGMAESEISEKFESKAQQGLFWARCNKCSSKNCKWCKMAKEFSDSTSKKQYKKMPEKKHPEKTVKTKKESANENFQKFLEEKITKMVDEKIEPKMKKKDLVKTIKKKVKNNDSMILRNPKKLTMFSDEAPMNLPIGQMFSIGKK